MALAWRILWERGDQGVKEVNIARVAVSQAIYAIDKPYDYCIPSHLSDKVQTGVRVMVPFGRGNKRCEAMVLAIAQREDTEKLKEILDVLDEAPILNEEALRLAFWVREQCFSSLYDVFRAQLPTGLWYRFGQVYRPSDGTSAEQIAAQLTGYPESTAMSEYFFIEKKGVTEKSLDETFQITDGKKVLDALCKAGLLTAQDIATRKVSDKTVRIASLAVSAEEAAAAAAQCGKRAPLQREVLNLLCQIGGASVAELCYFTGASTATMNTLVKRGLVALTEKETFRRPKLKKGQERQEIALAPEQARVFSALKEEVLSGQAGCSLLFGVTGSGKTLVYMKLIETVIAQGRSALMLVPEIALTPQMVERFYAYFGDGIAILHSALSVGERFDEWKRIARGEVTVVVGTRSAVFAPIPNLGLIIMDEEQEHTYKSGNTPRYHARNVAKFRCVQNGARLLLGSATPSVESMYAAKSGKYGLHVLQHRYNERAMPEVLIADMREELRNGNAGTIGRVLAGEIAKNLSRGEQSILFLNRRGQARYAMCVECGFVPECPHCSVSLTYHSANGRFMCHHCGYSEPGVSTCPECGGGLSFIGAGTQKIEDELHALFPDVPVLRMDHDTTSAKTSHEALLSRFEKEKIPIMVGTQMITKGLDFENVTLVGVLSADQSLYSDDWRAHESTFALITQVVGRAGRGEKHGRAVIQTMSPGHPLIHQAAAQDYENFYQNEINLREMRAFPPFRDIISILVSGTAEKDTLAGALRTAGKLRRALAGPFSDVKADLYGPAPAALLRVKGKYRYKLSLCCENSKRTRELVARILCDFRTDKQNRRLTITADVNPIDF